MLTYDLLSKMDSSITKMKDGRVNRKENNLFNVCATNKIQMKTESEKILSFFCNDYLLIKVNREKLLEKSAYFWAITKKCYKHHKSDSIEINIPASYGAFNKVMEFINTDVITLDIKTLLATSCYIFTNR